MPALRTQLMLRLAVITLLGAAPLAAASERFEKVWCLRYAVAPDAPLSMLLAGAPRDATLDVPFAICVARSPSQVVVLDSGYLNQKLGEPFGARDWMEYAPLLAEVGVELDEVDFVTLSHLRLFAEPEAFGFRRVSAHAIAIVE